MNEWNHQASFTDPPLEESVAESTFEKAQEGASAATSDDLQESKESPSEFEARPEEAAAE